MQHQSCMRVFNRTRNLHKNLYRTDNEEGYCFTSWLTNEGGYKKLLQEHCALARLIAEGIEFWVHDTTQMLQRFSKDNKEFGKLTGLEVNNRIVGIDDGLSDPHCGKQFVKRLSLANGSGIIYKPRDISSLSRLSEVIKKLSKYNDFISIKLPECLAKKNYGWVELIHHEPCHTKKQVEAYFHECGQLTALLYLTRTNDIHHENLIASGRHPTLIDGDTIFYPGFQDLFKPTSGDQREYTELAIEESVLSSGLLPLWDNINGELRDSSGIGAVLKEAENSVSLKGKLQAPNQYLNQIISGFRITMRYSLENKEILTSIIDSFKSSKARAIYRPTRIYERIRQNLLSPKNLIDGITRSIELEYLKSSLIKEEQKPQGWELINNEVEMLFTDDIPLFTINCGTNRLDLKSAKPLILTSGVEIAKARVERLTADFIAYQEELIQASCHFSAISQEERGVTGVDTRNNWGNSSDSNEGNRWNELFVMTADQLIERLTKRSHYSRNYGSSWIGINILEEYGRMQLSNAGLSLYNGSGGITLTLAARSIHSTCSDYRAKELLLHCNNALQPILDLSVSTNHTESLINTFGLGAMTGLGSLIYSCTICAKLLKLDNLLDAGERLTQRITPEMIQRETCADVMSGLSGLLISLIELNKQLNQKRLRDLCLVIGDQICNLTSPATEKDCAWPNQYGIMLLGLSHGSAGIAMALFRLYEQSGLQRFKETALRGIAYENTKRDPQTGHWLDLRNERPGIMNSWCNGAPGIGLARLAMYKISPDPQLLEDIEQAIHLVRTDEITELDQLCCGLLGHSELLLSAGIHFNRQDWTNAARELTKKTIVRASNEGGFRLLKSLPTKLPMPGFMQGEAGLAYQLLRINDPAKLPSILTLQT